jgi:hypothetical protein
MALCDPENPQFKELREQGMLIRFFFLFFLFVDFDLILIC